MKYIIYLGAIALNVIGWLIVLMIPALEITTCTMGSEDAWEITVVIIAPALFVLSCLLLLTKNIKWIKWLSIPQVILIPWSILVIVKYLVGVTFQGHHFCAVLKHPDFNSYISSWWAPYWAPVMLVAIGILSIAYWRVWRSIYS